MRTFGLYLLLIALLWSAIPATAQQKQFTLEEAVSGLSSSLAVENIRMPSWRPGTNEFFRLTKGSNNQYLVRTSFPAGKTDTVETLTALNQHIATDKPLKTFPALSWLDREYVWFRQGNQLYRGVLTANGFHWTPWIMLPDNAQNLTVDKSMQVAYTLNNNLLLIRDNGQTAAVTEETDLNIIAGQSVHRNEFGIDRGIFFSPQGNMLAYYQMDQRQVNDYPIVKWETVPANKETVKYPMAGSMSHEVTLRVYHPRSGRITILETGKPADQYLTSVTWSPNEKYLYVALLNRDQNHLQLNRYDAFTGKKLATLFEESDSRYVEPQHPLTFLPGSNDRFIWWSERDGYMHLYLYHTDGRLIRQLTKGKYEVNTLSGFCKEKGTVLITAAKETPLEEHVYSVSLRNGHIQRLDTEPGIHTIIPSEDGSYLYNMNQAANTPRLCLIRNAAGKVQQVLLTATNPLAGHARATVKNITLSADDGTTLYGRIILPSDFDPLKKYPVVVYLYNGPHAQLVRNSFPASGNLWYEYMAQRGYIIFTMDGRGSSNRGQQFEQAIFRQLGTVEMNDQLQGVAFLKSLPYVDAERMGVHGWSYGGFMTTSLMLRHPEVFKAGVAGGPVIDWSLYEIMYTERYMDTPEQNPEGYAGSSLFDKVKNLKGKLLLIHGTDDDVVVWQHSVKLLRQFISGGVQVDYFVYPGHPHNVRGRDRIHLMQKVTDYFDLHLQR